MKSLKHLKNFGITSPASTSPYKLLTAFFRLPKLEQNSPPLPKKKKNDSEVKPAGQTALTFLFGILSVNYSSPTAKNVG